MAVPDAPVLVLHPDDLGQAEGFDDVIVATGGATRDASVAAGLRAIRTVMETDNIQERMV